MHCVNIELKRKEWQGTIASPCPSWENGRRLASLTEGTTTWSYTYDADGMRTSRTGDGKTYIYTYNGSQLVQMTVGSDTLRFTYDAAGTPLSVNYNGTTYYYITNLQGDVTGVVTENGATVVTYSYDSWGELLEVEGTLKLTLGELNPIRYRGYVYDTETALYYLQTRYYDPDVGRFVNADRYATTGHGFVGNNMFAYCINNPMMYTDFCGLAPEWWQWLASGAMVIGGTILVATGVSPVAGSALIAGGVNSIVNSYVAEQSDVPNDAAWFGGLVTGLISGAGAGYLGNALYTATGLTGVKALTTIGSGVSVAYGTGFIGSLAGQYTTSIVSQRPLEFDNAIKIALINGSFTALAGIGNGIGTAVQELPFISTTVVALSNGLSAAWSLVVETILDTVNAVLTD